MSTGSVPAVNTAVIYSTQFLDDLIKCSTDAEHLIWESGRQRFQRAIADAVDLYLKTVPPGGTQEDVTHVGA